MIVVADTSPLNYLVLIGAVDILAPLYTRVVVPQTVPPNSTPPSRGARMDCAAANLAGYLTRSTAYGRAEAERRSLRVTGTLGVLVAAHRSGWLDFEVAVARLANTTFYQSPRLLATARRLLSIPSKS
jgi:predicted nucleic acid-binding protein